MSLVKDARREGKVLGIVYRTLETHITKKASYNKKTAVTAEIAARRRRSPSTKKPPRGRVFVN
jgi:hypothetical protein